MFLSEISYALYKKKYEGAVYSQKTVREKKPKPEAWRAA